MADEIGDCTVPVTIELSRADQPMGVYVWGKFVIIQPGQKKVFRFRVPADRSEILVSLYDKRKKPLKVIRVARPDSKHERR